MAGVTIARDCRLEFKTAFERIIGGTRLVTETAQIRFVLTGYLRPQLVAHAERVELAPTKIERFWPLRYGREQSIEIGDRTVMEKRRRRPYSVERPRSYETFERAPVVEAS